jgi:DNA topoisomerase-1
VEWKDLLARFWTDFSKAIEGTAELRISEVLDKINEVLAPHLFPDSGDGSDPRVCTSCGIGRLALKTARSGGAFIGCSNYPECRYTRPLGGDGVGDNGEGRNLGEHDGQQVTLRNGRFGPYVQLGEQVEGSPDKPKRTSVPKGMEIDLERAVALLSLPRLIGPHPEGGEPVEAGLGRFGPYVKHGKTFASLTKDEDVLTVGMNRAVELIAQKVNRGAGRGAALKPLRELGEHSEGGAVNLMDGRYGPYVKWEKVNATLPKGTDQAALTLEEALELVAAKRKSKKKK